MSHLEVTPPLTARDGAAGAPAAPKTAAADDGNRIAGVPVLKGLVVYGATLAFAGFYAYFMTRIASAPNGKPPALSATMVTAAAALAGVLGSAFALAVGTASSATNAGLGKALGQEETRTLARTRLRRVLSLEPGDDKTASWPLTFGIWAYALVAAAVALVYLLNQNETPSAIKALAVAFSGYAIALMTAAYGVATKG